MCKSTKGTKSANNAAIMEIPPNTVPGDNGDDPTPTPDAGPGPDLEANTSEPLFGRPDYAPQHTFIAQAAPGDNGFIQLAVDFHGNSGLAPITVSSIEEIVDKLGDSNLTGTGFINRIRIVSHVFFDSSGLQQPVNMLLKFLDAGSGPSLKRHFQGFAQSSIAALQSMMTFEVGSFSNTTHFLYRGSATTLMSFLRPAHAAILDSVPMDPLGEPGGEFNDFFLLAGSKWILSRISVFNLGETATIDAAYTILLDDIISRISSTIPEGELNTLKNAIIGLGNSQAAPHQTPFAPSQYAQNVQATISAIANDGFIEKLNRVRQRINQNSKIDIRGCQVGRDIDFLRAIQLFFGTNETVRPAVSGPRWFQHFNAIGNVTGLNSNRVIGVLHTRGFSPYNGTRVQQFLEEWSAALGITDDHLTFWEETFNLDILSFCALEWRSNIPNTAIPITRLQALTPANFTDLTTRLAAIFLVAAPTGSQMNALTQILSHMSTWSAQLNAVVADNSTPVQLTTHFNQYKTIYEGIDNRFTGTATPTPSQRIIPGNAPVPLTLAAVRDMQTALKTFIRTHSRSRLSPIATFIDNAKTNTQDGPAKMRYFLCLGLPFLLYDVTATNVNHNILVVYLDGSGVTEQRQDEAIKYWIRAQWRGFIPDTIGNGTTFENSRQTPWLVEHRQPGGGLSLAPFRVSPTQEFQDQIESITP